MGNVVCVVVATVSFGKIDSDSCIEVLDPPTPSRSPSATDSPVPADDNICTSNKRSVTVLTNAGDATEVVTLTLACLNGASIKQLQGPDCVQTSSSDIVCSSNPGPAIQACCNEVDSDLFVFGQLLNTSQGSFVMSTSASGDAESIEALGECFESGGIGTLPASCSMDPSEFGSVKYFF